jgi:uncharacterized membrane protein HdeD (DUF308 family)
MKITGLWLGIVAIIFGILILILPHLLSWLVGIALIVVGVLAILGRR